MVARKFVERVATAKIPRKTRSGRTLAATLTLLGAALSSLLGKGAMEAWGWRVPFLIGAVLGIYAVYLRRGLHETKAFEKEHDAEERMRQRPPLLRGIWENRHAALKVIGLVAGDTVAYYTWAVFAPAYAINVKGIDPQQALWAGVIGTLVYMAALPLWGALSDRWGRKPNLYFQPLALAALSFPLNWLVQDQAWQLLLAMCVASLVLAAFSSITPAVMSELFPTRVRASGFAFPYSIAVALFGGTAPHLQTYLAGRGLISVFIGYSIALLAVSFLTALTVKETKGISLE